MTKRRASLDSQLLSVALILLVLGIVMMYSASALWAERHFSDPFYFLKRQLLWAAIGLPVMLALSKLDYNRLGEFSWLAVVLTLLALAAALLSAPIAGVRRWIRMGPLGVQPAEFAKLAMILFLADFLDRKRSRLDAPLRALAGPSIIMAAMLGLILLEPDLGTPALMFLVALALLFIGGLKFRFIASAALCAAPVIVFELLRLPYRRRRVLNFLQPWSDPEGSGYQLVQSLLAVGSGGWFGKGLGSSELKLLHLPTPHTDFIFPIVCEELGLAGSLLVVGLFSFLLLRGIKIARSAPNLFGTLLAAGITLMVCLQAFFNMAMSLGLLPTKGVPLPFFSFGGSSLLVTLACMGILLSVSRQAQ